MTKDLKDLFLDGRIIQIFSKNTFLTVDPAFIIDRVKFSIIKLNTNGKQHKDFYLTCDEARRFCEEIDSGTAFKRISSDAGRSTDKNGKEHRNPSAYEWVSGVKGCKHLIIGMGDSGMTAAITVTNDNMGISTYYCPIKYSDLQLLSFRFKLVSGLIPVMDGSYYSNLFNAFLKGQTRSSEYFKKLAENELKDEMDEANTSISMDTENIHLSSEDTVKEELNKTVDGSSSSILNGKFRIVSPISSSVNKNGVENYSATVCVVDTGALETMIFYRNQIDDTEQFTRLREASNNVTSKGILIHCNYTKSKSYIYRGMYKAAA